MKKLLFLIAISLIITSCINNKKVGGVYRYYMGKKDKYDIWIVDGYMVRKNIYPDFGFSGNDLAYHFIPPKEIWIDGQVSCEETEYSISTEMLERKSMEKGKSYDDAFSDAIDNTQLQRQVMEELARSHFKITISYSTTCYAGKINTKEN